MSLTPGEAIDKNRGKRNLQFQRAVQDLTVEVRKSHRRLHG